MFRCSLLLGILLPLFAQQASAQESSAQKSSNLGGLVHQMKRVADRLVDSESLQAEFKHFAKVHSLDTSADSFHEYIKVKMAFETTRDGGLWHFKWNITREAPSSKVIWKHLQGVRLAAPPPVEWYSVEAECDELSAMFAFMAGQLGVKHVGLVWPFRGHTVAVWFALGDDGERKRIAVPTSQVLLSESATLGTKEFPGVFTQKAPRYRKRDAKRTLRLSPSLVKYFVSQLSHLSKNPQTLQRERNRRASHWGTSS